MRSRLSQKVASTNETPEILKQILKRAKSKSSSKNATYRGDKATMSVRQINYSEIFKNSVYRNAANQEKLPSIAREDSRPRLPKPKKVEVNKSALSFPNSDLALDIASTFDRQTKLLNYKFEVKNLEEEEHKELEEKLTEQITKEIRKLALRKIIEER